MVWNHITNNFKKRICKFILQNSLRPYIEGDLELDSLSLDLSNGRCTVRDFLLKTSAINELLQEADIPFKVVTGKLKEIKMLVPWTSIFSENSGVEIDGLSLVLEPHSIPTPTQTSLANSFYKQIKCMTTSMEMAKEYFEAETVNNPDTANGSFEGLEYFSEGIMEIFSRCKVNLKNVSIRLQNHNTRVGMNMGLNIFIPTFDFFDELIMDADADDNPKDDKGVLIKGCKHLRMDGLTITFDHSIGDEDPANEQEHFHDTMEMFDSNKGEESVVKEQQKEVIEIARFYGSQEAKVRYNSGNNPQSLKLDAECFLGSFCTFLCPKQIHLLTSFVSSLFDQNTSRTRDRNESSGDGADEGLFAEEQESRNKMITSTDYRKMQENYYNHLTRTKPSTTSQMNYFADDVDGEDQFYSLSMTDSVSYETKCETASLTRSYTTGSEASFDTMLNSRTNDFNDNNSSFPGIPETCINVQIKINSVIATLLHINPDESKNLMKASSGKKDLPYDLPTFAKNYFDQITHVLDHDSSREFNLREQRGKLSQLCHGHDHLVLTMSQFHGELENLSTSSSHCSDVNVNASIQDAELLECLNCENCMHLSQSDSVDLSRDRMYLYSEIFVFKRTEIHQQSLKFKTCVIKRNQESRTIVDTHISPFVCEVDLSIIDRLNNLLTPPDMFSAGGQYSSNTGISLDPNNSKAENFDKLLKENNEKRVINIRLSSPNANARIRFPVPDLRPELECAPWFTRSLRDEYLLLTLHDVVLSTKALQNDVVDISSRGGFNEFFVKSRDIEVFYADEADQGPKPFIRIFQDADPRAKMAANASPSFTLKLSSHTPAGIALLDCPVRTDLDDSTEEFYCEDANEHGRKDDPSTSSPFSAKENYYNGKHVVLPGNDQEIQAFIDESRWRTDTVIDLQLPNVVISLPSESFFENLYNRLSYDLLLWMPKAPKLNHVELPEAMCSSFIVPSKLDLASQSFYQKHSSTQGENTTESVRRFRSFSRNSDDSVGSNSTIRTVADAAGTSAIALNLNIGKAKVSAFSSLNHTEPRDEQRDEISILLENVTLYYISGFNGDPLLDYMCVQIRSLSLYHIEDSLRGGAVIDKNLSPPANKSPVIYMSSKQSTSTFRDQSVYHKNMVTLSLKITTAESGLLKNCFVAAVLHGATYEHIFQSPGSTWVDNLVHFLEVEDSSVLGYVPPSFLTEAHVYAYNCIMEYKPNKLQLPKHVVITVSQFWLSCNVVAESPLFNVQFNLEQSCLLLSKRKQEHLNLDKNFVKLLEVDILDVSFSMLNKMATTTSRKHPFYNMCVHKSSLKLLTCSDSCTALMSLMQYIATNGDSVTEPIDNEPQPPTAAEEKQPVITTASSSKELANELEVAKEEDLRSAAAAKREERNQQRMMQSVYQEKKYIERKKTTKRMYESFPNRLALGLSQPDDDDDFCVIDDAEALIEDKEPQIVYFNKGEKVKVIENHFRPVVGKRDQLQSPTGLPLPAYTHQIQSFSCIWRMYGGKDFAGAVDTRGARGGDSSRRTDVLIELHVDKARFQHDIYEECEKELSRTVLLVEEFEIRDRLQSSDINKFFYRFYNEATPKQLHAPMFLVKALLKRPETDNDLCECRLRVSVQPIRLNIDQDSLEFLTKFLIELSGSTGGDCDIAPPSDDFPTPMASPDSSFSSSEGGGSSKPNSSGVFFEEFVFSPEVPIRVDYNGKRVNVENGSIAGIVMGLAHLNCSQLTLRRISYRRGLLGIDRVLSFALNEWTNDIKQNQLPSILGGVGPMHSVVQLFQGVRDLVWLPIEQYRRDGRIIRGVQRGTASFGTSTAMATLEIANRFICLIQGTAETMYEVVTPSDLDMQKQQRNWKTTLGKQIIKRHEKQPGDLREGLSNAMTLMREGCHDTAYSIARVAHKEHEHKGITGAVGGVLRHIPTTVVRPVIFASKATSNLLCGMRNQILPNAKQEDDDKWRTRQDKQD